MNRAIVSLLILLLLGSSLPAAGSAATNQNLQWGVEVGDRFDYRFQKDEVVFDCYIIVDSLPAIQDEISEIYYLDFFNITPVYTLYFANGTNAGWWAFDLTQLIIPMGNWSLWSTLLNDYMIFRRVFFDSLNTTETVTSWTWVATARYGSPDLRNLETVATFRKSNGVLSYYRYVLFTDEGDIDFELIIRQTDFLTRAGPYILVSGYLVALIAACILYRKR